MQILEVILFSKKDEPRVIRFKENTVNIIHSNPNTGKTSLLDIIDYCLGQHTNHIKSTKIHDLVSWLGITIKINGERYFIARKNVEYGTTTELMYLEHITDSSPRTTPEGTNINRLQLLNFLNSQLGIEKIPLEYKEGEDFYVNVRHTSFFCYLTQNEIDATDSLYHRSHDGFLNNQIRLSLEYFLGTFDEDIFLDFLKLQKIRRELATVRSKLKEYELIRGNVYEKAYELLGKCQKHGIHKSDELPSDLSEYVQILTQIITNWKPMEMNFIPEDISEMYDKIFSLKEELNKKEETIYELKKYSNTIQNFKDESDHQRKRLKLIEIFETKEGGFTCPICEQTLDTVPKKIEQIKADFVQLKSDLGNTTKIKRYVSDITEQVEKEKTDLQNDINKLTSKIKGFLNEQQISKDIFKENLKISELIGEVKLWLESIKESDDESTLGKEKRRLLDKIKQLEDAITLNEESYRRTNILESINDNLQKWAPQVEIYRAKNYVFKYDVNTISLFTSTSQKMNYSNLGGGHNMLGIHIILYLALHKHFLDARRPVPHFIVFDQLSTPYFSQDPDRKDFNSFFAQDPREKLVKMYQFIIEQTKKMKNIQVIITDQPSLSHEEWYDEHLVKDWNDALIPSDWK